jgi:hypothetical protein
LNSTLRAVLAPCLVAGAKADADPTIIAATESFMVLFSIPQKYDMGELH